MNLQFKIVMYLRDVVGAVPYQHYPNFCVQTKIYRFIPQKGFAITQG